MSKTSQCIELLKILYSRSRIVGINELADILETNPRNIPEYVNELRSCGYEIKTVHGRYGGYLLERHGTFPTLKLTDTEREGLMVGYEYLLARNDFMRKADFSKAMGKITTAILSRNMDNMDVSVIYRYPDFIDEQELTCRYRTIEQCIKEKRKLLIEYKSNDNVIRRRVIHPYKLYMYNNSWFTIAYCETRERFLFFKLIRMVRYEILHERFRRLHAYIERDYLDEYGMKNGDWHEVKLKFTGRHAMFAGEYRYGKNQKVEYVDENTTIITVTMQYRDDIVGFVLSHQGYCEVLEPEWLKEEAVKTSYAIYSQYARKR